MLRNSKKGVMTGVYAALVVLLILTLVFAVNFGSVDIYYKDVFQIVYGKIFNKDLSAYKSSQINIIWALRLPKVIVAACTGAGLVLTGILMQAITKNPLADPYVLGISSGASAGAVVSLLIGTLPVIGRVPLAESSFAGALLTAVIVFVFGSKNGKINTTKMILVGMALSSFFSALTNIIIFLTPDSRRVQTATFWLSGSFAGTDWGDVPLAVGVLVVGLVLTLPLTRELDALLIGEDIARNTGVNTVRVKWILILTQYASDGDPCFHERSDRICRICDPAYQPQYCRCGTQASDLVFCSAWSNFCRMGRFICAYYVFPAGASGWCHYLPLRNAGIFVDAAEKQIFIQ